MILNFGGNPQQQMEMKAVNDEFMTICKGHPDCTGCPLAVKDVQMSNSTVRCNTGRGDFKNGRR